MLFPCRARQKIWQRPGRSPWDVPSPHAAAIGLGGRIFAATDMEVLQFHGPGPIVGDIRREGPPRDR